MQDVTGTITLTKVDRDRLQSLIASRGSDRALPWHVTALREEIARAKVVDPKKVPADVVTINSTIQVRRGSSDSTTFTIVYPDYEDIEAGYISVLSPMGLALIGTRVGDEVEWTTPAGPRRYTIEKMLYQPEADHQFSEKTAPPQVQN